jgi:serine/threonine protein kinase
LLKNENSFPEGEEQNLARKALMDEIKILCFIGKHENVVEVKGVQKNQWWLALEHCEHGSLHSFLAQKRDRGFFIDEIERPTVVSALGYHVTPQEDGSRTTIYKVRVVGRVQIPKTH